MASDATEPTLRGPQPQQDAQQEHVSPSQDSSMSPSTLNEPIEKQTPSGPSSNPSPPPTKPKVCLAGSEALVWDVQDVRRLRQSHRILGSLSGSLPRSAMQNIFQGLPLRLLPEEVYVLRSHDLVDLVDESRSYLQQSSSSNTTTTQGSKMDSSTTRNPAPKNGSEHITLHTRSDRLPYYAPVLISQAHDSYAGDELNPKHDSSRSRRIPARSPWTAPATPRHRQKYAVFVHLWETQKFFLAPGAKFGGDYLLYRKDPLICHASLIVTVQDSDKPVSLSDLASSARLASTVQKQHLICSLTGYGRIESEHQSQPRLLSEQEPGLKVDDQSQASSSTSDHRSISNSNIMMFAVEWAGF